MSKKHPSDGEMLKGTLDMMILRTLVTGDAHGHTIAKVIERTSEDVLEVEQGSLYPALHRMEDRGWVSSYWGRARTIAKRSFTGPARRAEGNLPVKRAAGGR
jgi:PadR family transcriptional regulator, regulatory protein PadR